MLATWRYRHRNSIMEKIDPRARWIFSLSFLFAVTLFWDVRILAGFFVVAFIWYLCARIEWRDIRRAWAFVLFLMFMIILVNTIITGGGAAGKLPKIQHTIFEMNWPFHLTLTIERVWFAISQFFRIGAISEIFLIIPYTMDPRLYGFTFKGLGLPDRFAFSMDLAFRFVPTLARDFAVTLDAQRARGYEIERVQGGLFAQIRRIAPLVVPVTMGSILTGEDVTNAMDLRCFGLHKRTWIQTMFFNWYDYAIAGFSGVLLIASFVLSILGIGDFWWPGI